MQLDTDSPMQRSINLAALCWLCAPNKETGVAVDYPRTYSGGCGIFLCYLLSSETCESHGHLRHILSLMQAHIAMQLCVCGKLGNSGDS